MKKYTFEIGPTIIAPAADEVERRCGDLLATLQAFDAEQALRRYAERFPRALATLRLGGLDLHEILPLWNPFTGEVDKGDFRNVAAHCLAVGFCGEALAAYLCDRGAMTEHERDAIIEHCIVHDAAKRLEIFQIRHVGRKGFFPAGDFYEVLRARGMDRSIVEALEACGGDTGAENISRFVKRDGSGNFHVVEGMLENKIVRLADSMVATTTPSAGKAASTYFVTFIERTLLCRFPERYPALYTTMLDYQADTLCPAANGNGVATFLQIETASLREMSREICDLAGERAEDAEQALKQIVNGDMQRYGLEA